ncbi:MAG: ArsR family transcriptional regulator [Candidatus Bathyarchaeia archaeon]|jgi:predicted DNA-binding transcriptional regulator
MTDRNADRKNEEVLHGKTLLVYRFIITKNEPVGVREIQRKLKFSSPSLAQYHIDKLKNEGLIKEETGGYIADKVILKNLVRFRNMLIPRFFFYFLVFTLGFIVELTLLLPPIVTREYAVAVGFTLAGAVAFGVETYRNWRRL